MRYGRSTATYFRALDRAWMLPRITLITPSFQQAAFLEECLASVHAQGYPHLEHIVVDGGSTDGSVAIIERYAARLAWWCSEKDLGQSHAINKGMAHATGQVFGWINSDDALLPGALPRVGEAFASDPDLIVLSGIRLNRSNEHGDVPMPIEDADDPESYFVAPRINQQATFYRLKAVRDAGLLDEDLHFAMDYELWLQVLFRNGVDGVRVEPWELALFRSHPDSKTNTVHHRFLDEIASVLFGMCERVGAADLAGALAAGHRITPGLRAMPVGAEDRERVRAMVFHFLLKWHHTVYTPSDLRMMRMFRHAFPTAPPGLTDVQRSQLERLDDQLRAPNWLAFRLRRKLKHWLG